MIVRRFLAAFYPPAEFEVIKFNAKANKESFWGSKKFLVKTGFYDIAGVPGEYMNDAGDDNIKTMQKGNYIKVRMKLKKV